MEDHIFENYPLDEKDVERWISGGVETTRLEFKREINIATKDSKREFIRDMISLANMAWLEDNPSYLLVGIDNSGIIVDISNTLSDEAIYQQIITAFIDPPIDFILRKIIIRGKNVHIFVIKKGDMPHITKKQIIGEKGLIVLDKGECWYRKGSSKYPISIADLLEQDKETNLPKSTIYNRMIWNPPDQSLTKEDIEVVKQNYQDYNDIFWLTLQNELKNTDSDLYSYFLGKNFNINQFLNFTSTDGTICVDSQNFFNIIPKILFLNFLAVPKLRGITLTQYADILGLESDLLSKCFNSCPQVFYGARRIIIQKKDPLTNENIFSLIPESFRILYPLVPPRLQNPTELFHMKFGGKIINSEKGLVDLFRFDLHDYTTFVNDTSFIDGVLHTLTKKVQPILIVGKMGTGKTVCLYQLGKKLIDAGYSIFADPKNITEDLMDELNQLNAVLLIDDFDQFLESKEISTRKIPPNIRMVCTIRQLNWNRLERQEFLLKEIFFVIPINVRQIDDEYDKQFLTDILWKKIEEYNINLPEQQKEQERVISKLLTKSEGLVLYVTEVISDIRRIGQRIGNKFVLDDSYLHKLPSGLLELAIHVLHRDFIHPSQNQLQQAYQIELTTLSLYAYFNYPKSSPGVIHKKILKKLTLNLKKLWKCTIVSAFQTPSPIDFLIHIGCDLYAFSHSFWMSVFTCPQETFAPIKSETNPFVETIIDVLSAIGDKITTKRETMQTLVNKAVEEVIDEQKSILTRALIINALNIPYASPIPEWLPTIPETLLISWLDEENDSNIQTNLKNIPKDASKSEFWHLLIVIIGDLIEYDLLPFNVGYYFKLVIKTNTYQTDPDCFVNINNLIGTHYLQLGWIEEARQIYLETLEITQKNNLIKHLGACYGCLGDVEKESGCLDSAKEFYNKSLAMDKVVDEEMGINSATTYLRLVEVSLQQEDYNYAEEILPILIEYGIQEYKFEVLSKAKLLTGFLEWKKGDIDQALTLCCDAKEIGEKYSMQKAIYEAEVAIKVIEESNLTESE